MGCRHTSHRTVTLAAAAAGCLGPTWSKVAAQRMLRQPAAILPPPPDVQCSGEAVGCYGAAIRPQHSRVVAQVVGPRISHCLLRHPQAWGQGGGGAGRVGV